MTNLKPNSITLSGSKLVGNQLRTSFEPASVMEFGFYWTHDADAHLFMADQWNRAGHYIFALWFLSFLAFISQQLL